MIIYMGPLTVFIRITANSPEKLKENPRTLQGFDFKNAVCRLYSQHLKKMSKKSGSFFWIFTKKNGHFLRIFMAVFFTF